MDGDFETHVFGTKVSATYKGATLSLGFSSTANDSRIRSPFGSYPGYLSLYSDPGRPGVVRVVSAREAPPGLPAPADPRLRYVARFEDLDAARMHLHEALRRGLVDVDAGL